MPVIELRGDNTCTCWRRVSFRMLTTRILTSACLRLSWMQYKVVSWAVDTHTNTRTHKQGVTKSHFVQTHPSGWCIYLHFLLSISYFKLTSVLFPFFPSYALFKKKKTVFYYIFIVTQSMPWSYHVLPTSFNYLHKQSAVWSLSGWPVCLCCWCESCQQVNGQNAVQWVELGTYIRRDSVAGSDLTSSNGRGSGLRKPCFTFQVEFNLPSVSHPSL